MDLRAARSLDLRTGWEFDDPGTQSKAVGLLQRDKPWLTITSPPCDPMSPLTIGLNYPKQDPEQVRQNVAWGIKHVKFAINICWIQKKNGRYFLHEHPLPSASWDLPEVVGLANESDVIFIHSDMCRFKMNVTGEGLNKKPEGLLTNSPEIAEEVDKRCECNENDTLPHVPLIGGVALQSGVFVKDFQKAIQRGLNRQLVDMATGMTELDAF